MKPTHETYSALQAAYEYFNGELFGDALPECLITLARKGKRVYGYFWRQRFEEIEGGHRADEIAMNPRHFKRRSIEQVLSTLVHEMAHQWQEHYGKPSRRGYHNREWAKKMESLGLMPSDTGEPSGKKTGQRVSHYILLGGPFAVVCAVLLSDGFKLAWGEIVAEVENDDMGIFKGVNAISTISTRVKFTCPRCGANAWGKSSLKLVCGDCEISFEPADAMERQTFENFFHNIIHVSKSA